MLPPKDGVDNNHPALKPKMNHLNKNLETKQQLLPKEVIEKRGI